MNEKQLNELTKLIDMPKRELRLLVGSDDSIQNRLDETRGWSRGDLIHEAINRGLTSIETELDKIYYIYNEQ